MGKPESKPASASPSNENVEEVETEEKEDADKTEMEANVEEVAAKLNQAMMEETEKMAEAIKELAVKAEAKEAAATTSKSGTQDETGSVIVSRPSPAPDAKAKEPVTTTCTFRAKDETGSDIVSRPSPPSSDNANEPVIVSTPFSPPKVTDGVYDDEFEVEAILARRTRDGQVQYLLKWVAWPDDSNTWEPEEHLANCKGLLDEFNEKWNADQLTKKGAKRGNDENGEGTESENGTKKAKTS